MRDLLLCRSAQGGGAQRFTDLDEIRTRLAEFEARYNAVAGPYNWRFTRTDLHALLDRLAAHEQAVFDLAA